MGEALEVVEWWILASAGVWVQKEYGVPPKMVRLIVVNSGAKLLLTMVDTDSGARDPENNQPDPNLTVQAAGGMGGVYSWSSCLSQKNDCLQRRTTIFRPGQN